MNEHIEIVIAPPTLSERFEKMLSAYKELAQQLQSAFEDVDLSDAIAGTVKLSRYTEKFSGQLLYLRLSLGRLRAAFTDAFAPIGAYVLPVINRLINRLAGFLQTIGAVLAVVMDNVRGTDAMAQSADKAAGSYKNLGTAAKRTLAGFDQIERLNAGTDGTAVTTGYDPATPLTSGMQQAVSKILQLLNPLLQIDLEPLKTAFSNMWQVVSPLLSKLGELLQWLWLNVAVPFIAWCTQSLFPALTDTFSGALETVSSSAGSLITGLQLLWNAMKPVADFVKEAIITCLLSWQQVFGELSAQLGQKGPEICTIFNNIAQVIQRIWAVIGPVLKALYTQFQQTFAGLGKVAAQAFGAVLQGLAGLSEFVAGIFAGNWKRAWDGILYAFKGMINSLIGLLNAMLVKLTGSLNTVIRLANSLKFKVPSWVPGIGGQQFGFDFKTVSAPQIPYLAKGAVLPANKPFLAMVGDQRHGTNIEAPLETIQQAVATVMEDMTMSNLAGHQTTAAVLRQILEAVLGISIGDELIAGAVDRYSRKSAVMQGVAYG